MKLSELQGYTVVSNPTNLTPNESSSALANSTHVNSAVDEHKSAYQKVSDAITGFFPGAKVGEAIGTLGGYMMASPEEKKQYDLSHPSVKQVLGDVTKGAALVGGLEAALPAGIWGKAAQFAKYGALESAGQAMTQDKSAKEIAKEAGKGGLIGGATGGVFGVLGNVAKKVAAPFKEAFDSGISNLFKKEGIKAPVSAMTKSPFLKGAEAVASKTVFGQGVTDIAQKASQDLETKVTNLVNKIKPEKIMSEENLGKMIKDGVQEFKDKFMITENKIYEDFLKSYGKSNVYGKETKDALSTIINEQGADYFKGVDPRLNKMLSKLTGSADPELKELEEQIAEFKGKGVIPPELEKEYNKKLAELDKNLSFNELKSTRTSIGEQLQKEPENTALKRLYGALSNDMRTAVSKFAETPFGDEAKIAGEALDKLNAGYESGMKKIESHLAQSVEMSNPEQIAQNLIKRNSADSLKQLKEMVGPARFKEVSKYFLRDKLESSMTRGAFDIDKFKKNLGEYDKETIAQLFNAKEQEGLNEVIKSFEKYQSLSNALKEGGKMGAGSQTAFLQGIKDVPVRASGFVSALVSGHPGVASLIALETAGEYGFAKLFTTDLGRTILTEGLNPKNSQLLTQAGYSTAAIAKIQKALGGPAEEDNQDGWYGEPID